MSEIENTLEWMLKASKIEGWVREFKYLPLRRCRADFAFPGQNLLVEIEGGVYTKGRHTRGKGFTHDCVKYNEALLLGWRVLRVTPEHVNNGMALDWIERALKCGA